MQKKCHFLNRQTEQLIGCHYIWKYLLFNRMCSAKKSGAQYKPMYTYKADTKKGGGITAPPRCRGSPSPQNMLPAYNPCLHLPDGISL